MSVRTFLPFCSSAQARSLEAGSSRPGDAQVLPFSTGAFEFRGAPVFDRPLHMKDSGPTDPAPNYLPVLLD